MAAPSGTVWGSIKGSYGRIGLYISKSSTATETDVTVQVWFWSKYSLSDGGNTLYYDCESSSTVKSEATTSRGSITLKTTVDTGAGWSTSNQVLLKTYNYTFDRGTSVINRYVYAKYANVDRVGATMYINTSFAVPKLESYTISYNANGGSGAPSAQTKWYGKAKTLSGTKPTRTGYSFRGWSTANDSSVEYAAGASYTANAAVTLYAVWKANTYTVSYNANGGTGAPGNQTKTYGTALKLSSTKPTRTNYNFLGWATSKAATSATYAAGGNYTNNAAVTLYAVWKLAYRKPRITKISTTRCNKVIDSEGNVSYANSEEGKYAFVSFTYACDKAISSIKINWSTAKGSGSSTVPVSASSGSVTTVIGNNDLDVEATYTVKVTVTDAMGSNYGTTFLAGLKLAIDVLPENAGVSFGKPAELKDVADFNFSIYPRKGFTNVPIELLWDGKTEGNKLMTADETIYFTRNINTLGFGIWLVFARDPNDGSAPYAWHTFFLPKTVVSGTAYNGSGHTFIMSTSSFAGLGTKYLYIRNNGINGNDNNNKSGTGSGITYNNAAFRLCYVLGV